MPWICKHGHLIDWINRKFRTLQLSIQLCCFQKNPHLSAWSR
jgi:hypothetical protein